MIKIINEDSIIIKFEETDKHTEKEVMASAITTAFNILKLTYGDERK